LYALSSPIVYVDPTGLASEGPAACGLNCVSSGVSVTGLALDAAQAYHLSRFSGASEALDTASGALVLPGLALQFFGDLSSGVDPGRALGRLGANAGVEAGILDVSTAGGPVGVLVGLALDVVYTGASLLFPNQVNGAIDASINTLAAPVNMLASGFRWLFGANPVY